MSRMRSWWEDLRSSLWFVPTLVVLASIALAVLMIELSEPLSSLGLSERWPRLFGAGADGSRGLLTAIATSMITVAGVAFSITVVALALASSQYSSRILRNFMRDRGNQAVLGFLSGVFAYSILVLRTIRGGDEGSFVPGAAVLVGVLLSFAAIGFLIFFIHHVATSIQATAIVGAATKETLRVIDRLFPREPDAGSDEPGGDEADIASGSWTTIPAETSGHVQEVDDERLFDIACERDVTVRMELRIGEFALEGAPLLSVQGRALDRETARELASAVVIGATRGMHNDPGFGIRQIVDVALKALSPAINDTTTAITCVNALAAILARLVTRRVEARPRVLDGCLRVIPRGPTFALLLGKALDQIRQSARGNVALLARLVEVIGTISAMTSDPVRREALRRHLDLVIEEARKIPGAHDRGTVMAAKRVVATAEEPRAELPWET